jgi:hypothetical protein
MVIDSGKRLDKILRNQLLAVSYLIPIPMSVLRAVCGLASGRAAWAGRVPKQHSRLLDYAVWGTVASPSVLFTPQCTYIGKRHWGRNDN